MAKKVPMEKALEIVFEKIKPSYLPLDVYNKFRTYRNRYEKGKLSQTGINTLLEYFGYSAETTYTYNPKKDKSKK